MNAQFQRHVVAALTLLCAAATAPCAAEDSEPPTLVIFDTPSVARNLSPLTEDGEATLKSLSEDANISMLRIGHSAPEAALQATAFSLTLSPASGHAVQFRDVERTDHPNGMVSLYAQDHAAGSETSIVIDGLDVLGRVHDGQGNTWRLTPLGGGLTAVYQYDTSNFRMHPPGWDPGGALDFDTAPREHTPENTGAGADAGDVIDVMVVYTRRARMHVRNIDAFIQQAFDNARQHYENSKLPFRLRLVHSHETAYVESGEIRDDLMALGLTSDGKMDEAHPLRDRYGADLVHLFVYYDIPPGIRRTCGVATYAHLASLAHLAGGATDVDCEQSRGRTFTHEIGHNQGAAHDRPNVGPPYSGPAAFPYGYGYCHPSRRWATIMAYLRSNNNCVTGIPYFSSSDPTVRYDGLLPGNATTDNRRVLLETARTVANHRQSRTRPSTTHTLPMVPPASNTEQQGFVRVINNSNRAGEVEITAIDDRGGRYGPVTLSLEARAAAHFNSQDLENGNSEKGLSGRAGNGYGNWRLELSTDLEIEHLAYVRTSDGFVTNMHEVAAETQDGSNRYHVPFFNPGSNRSQESKLRLINPGSSSASIEITGVDDDGRAPPRDPVRLNLGAGMARILTAYQLESGGAGLTGGLGAGQGKWRLSVSANRPIQVMSLLELPTGHVTNLSRGQDGISFAPPPPPPPSEPDLIVQSSSVSNPNPGAGETFEFRGTIRNQGDSPSPSTSLRFLVSTDATISTTDSELIPASGRRTVPGLAPSASTDFTYRVTFPRQRTVYIGVCIDPVPDESDSANNCSSGVRVAVGQPDGILWGAIAAGWADRSQCRVGWNGKVDRSNRDTAAADALSACRNRGLADCRVYSQYFTACGSLSAGLSGTTCHLVGGQGATSSQAEQNTVFSCNRAGYTRCRILQDGNSGRKATYCNSGSQASSLGEGRASEFVDSLSGTADPRSGAQESHGAGEAVVARRRARRTPL